MRFFLQFVLPFLLPTLAFLAWVWLTRNQRPDGAIARIQRGPWFWLVVAGCVLTAGGLGTIALISGSEPGTTYTAPRFEDGRVVPGRFE